MPVSLGAKRKRKSRERRETVELPGFLYEVFYERGIPMRERITHLEDGQYFEMGYHAAKDVQITSPEDRAAGMLGLMYAAATQPAQMLRYVEGQTTDEVVLEGIEGLVQYSVDYAEPIIAAAYWWNEHYPQYGFPLEVPGKRSRFRIPWWVKLLAGAGVAAATAAMFGAEPSLSGAKRREKVRKGKWTKKSTVWDKAAALPVRRFDPLEGRPVKLDPGVHYFVLMLNQLGATTYFSCEGHPDGFYVSFDAPYDLALAISQAGFFAVELEKRRDHWSIRKHTSERVDPTTGKRLTKEAAEKSKVDALRWAADAWEQKLGPLDFKAVTLEG